MALRLTRSDGIQKDRARHLNVLNEWIATLSDA